MRFALALFALLLVTSAQADARYCGEPLRDKNGKIVRDSRVLREFQKLYPCPATGKRSGACPGWAKDHIIPLASCGCDSIENLQWLPNEIKSCAGTECKDRWERKIYRCAPQAGR
jgi:hypothetical protein